ncbi:hypothetical protein PSHT_11023 [Puccinia striiformis]|nr:hypothetical protein H4Q26_012705 [Puccinia striiformis f. sp. tritici PST-130]KAI9626439.1 hypothetical protein H4Q26_017854 [Puccinia striiformis f. sp. tritici PST-130]KNF02781.1 hypothetical protein PSTG_04066 [Puccinia striiformis f. sp. tritici PST-78]POW04894.1 hypothetical protein PSHT_11023 [Puccinia striiformis]
MAGLVGYANREYPSRVNPIMTDRLPDAFAETGVLQAARLVNNQNHLRTEHNRTTQTAINYDSLERQPLWNANWSMGWWGNMGGPKQKGITEYSLSPYRQSPGKHAFRGWLFQGYRRLACQVPYWIVPFGVGYGVIKWADADNHFRNTKAGHAQGKFP